MARLGLVVILLVGLVVTTPVVCVCGPTDHGGQALHSLLPHTHEHPHETATETIAAVDGESPADLRAQGITAQTGGGAGALTAAGAVGLALVQPWRLVAAPGEPVITPGLLAPPQPDAEPPGPPPRRVIG